MLAIARRGNEILLVKDASVLHDHKREKFLLLWRHSYRFGYNQVRVWKKKGYLLLLGLIRLPLMVNWSNFAELL